MFQHILETNTFMFALMPALFASFCSSLYFKLSRSMSVDHVKSRQCWQKCGLPAWSFEKLLHTIDWVKTITSLVGQLPVQTSIQDRRHKPDNQQTNSFTCFYGIFLLFLWIETLRRRIWTSCIFSLEFPGWKIIAWAPHGDYFDPCSVVREHLKVD